MSLTRNNPEDASGKSFICTKNGKGSKQEPSGTPIFKPLTVEETWPILTNSFLSDE